MIARWGMGLRGAALASGISVMVPMSCGIIYFLSKHSTLRFLKFSWKWQDMARTLFNGSSEMIGQLSIGITTWMFNTIILSRMGADGVAAFAIAGYQTEELEARFGGMLRALQYGAPPHGGIAPGIDRMVMLLCGEENLREVVMFPMNQQAEDLLMGAPSDVSPEQLKELSIRISLQKAKG